MYCSQAKTFGSWLFMILQRLLPAFLLKVRGAAVPTDILPGAVVIDKDGRIDC